MSNRTPRPKPRAFVCWWADIDPDPTTIKSTTHEHAVTSFLMLKYSDHLVHENAPDADRVGVVDLESGECRFVSTKIHAVLVRQYQGGPL